MALWRADGGLKRVECGGALFEGAVVCEAAGGEDFGGAAKAGSDIGGRMGIGADGDDPASLLAVAAQEFRAGVGFF